MSFKDVLVQLSSYPERTPAATLEQAVRIAEALGARLSALAFKIEIPNVGNVLANTLLDVSGMVAVERQKSAANVKLLISEIESLTAKRGVACESIVESCTNSQLAALVTEHARLHDIAIIPISEQALVQRYVAESVVFGSGRPTILRSGRTQTTQAVVFRRGGRGLGLQPVPQHGRWPMHCQS